MKSTVEGVRQPNVVSQFALRRLVLSAVVAAYITLLLNQPVVSSLLAIDGWSLLVPLLVVLFGINLFLSQLLSISRLQKPWLILLVSMAAGSQYFIQQFGIVIDKNMLINILETDSREATDLLSSGMFVYGAMYILLPALLIGFIGIRNSGHAVRIFAIWAGSLMASLAVVAIVIFSQYQSYASVFREHRYLSHQALPLSVLTASYGAAQTKLSELFPPPFIHIAKDTRLMDADITATTRPQLVVLVLGETARADHLSINGYERKTTPELERRQLVNFGAIDACGTATAVSLPCMFSYLSRENYDDTLAKHSDNVLDVLAAAGVRVLWLDNNSGCKEVCARIDTENLFSAPQSSVCEYEHCQDTILLEGLRDRLIAELSGQRPVLVVLHQQGNHGPEYYKRSDKTQKRFLPECTTNMFDMCTQQEIINAYDNAIVATDAFLADTITLLESLDGHYDATMMYVSDHGESLGENGVYLHGLPYWMAPDAQKKVPFLMWRPGLDSSVQQSLDACKESGLALSHDYLFDSLLHYMRIQTSFMRPELDFFQRCPQFASELGLPDRAGGF